MKQLYIFLFLCLSGTVVLTRPKIELGLLTKTTWNFKDELTMRFRYFRDGFIREGVEAFRLFNYDSIKNNPEHNRIFGFVCQIQKLKWRIEYHWSFDEQEVKNYDATPPAMAAQ